MSTSLVNSIVSLLLLFLSLSSNLSLAQYYSPDTLKNHIDHYWDCKDLSKMSDEDLEQNIVDFLFLSLNADPSLRQSCWQKFSDIFPDQPMTVILDYLGEPDSPLYAPQMLEEYLTSLSQYLPDDNPSKLRVLYFLNGFRKNKPGSFIANISLTRSDTGQATSLYDILKSQSDHVYILLYDPDCPNCLALLNDLASSSRNTIISINVNPLSSSDSYATNFPDSSNFIWCVPSDPEQLEEAFFLRSLPLFYSVSSSGVIL